MTPDQARILQDLSERLLLRDLATLAELNRQNAALVNQRAAQRAALATEAKAMATSPDMLAQAYLAKFAQATDQRDAELGRASAALKAPRTLAQAAAQRAFGRAEAVKKLAARAEETRRDAADRAEERILTAIALSKAVRSDPQQNRFQSHPGDVSG